MGIKINSFGGPIIWILRKFYSQFTSKIMLEYAKTKSKKIIKQYIEWFMNQAIVPLPKNVMIETINRCNGTCDFCPANVRDEKRTLRKMSDNTFYNIIKQLKELNWKGKLFMCVNNEPFIDKRIVEFTLFAKKELKDVKIAFITNGTLLTEEIMNKLSNNIDLMVINNYSSKYKLSEKNKRIYRYIKKNADKFRNIDITINRRYVGEILTTRAGSSPNKPYKNINIQLPCLYPFTDFIIFPDGKVGMCCNDCYEVTDFGNVNKQTIKDIWEGDLFNKLREKMRFSREYAFCKECDVMDAGGREADLKNNK